MLPYQESPFPRHSTPFPALLDTSFSPWSRENLEHYPVDTEGQMTKLFYTSFEEVMADLGEEK
jgi:hypothetical protein